jgi:hypothetical protein
LKLAIIGVLSIGLSLAASAAESVKVLSNIPYAEDVRIASKIRRECTQLGTKLSDFFVKYATSNGNSVQQVSDLDTGADGYVLIIEITGAVSSGNAFIGHAKYMEAHGELFLNGELVDSVDYSRDSMGGLAASFKGSCSVLGRNSKALGKDFATWLSNRQELK